MKCPKCGFVSFPGLNQCKKCGHHFTPVENQQPGIPPLFRRPSEETIQPAAPASRQSEGKEPGALLEDRDLNPMIDPGKRFLDSPEPGATEAAASGPAAPLDWQKELAERMQEFRRRRARISTGKEEDEKSLGIDFKSPASNPDEPETQPNLIEFPSFDELNLREDSPPGSDPDLDAFALETPRDETAFRGAASAGPGPFRREPLVPAVPMEIELESSAASARVGGRRGNASVLRVASLGKRFFAGIFDLLVLLSAAGVFALIFWQAGGRLPLLPLNMAVAAMIVVIFLLAYFGVFTVFVSGTPGLIWAGLEVRTFEGNPPKRVDFLWRSFGYLVSVSALLLGFIWALVDGEGLTWHDRMSGTLLVDAQDWETLQAASSVSP